jgi:hypothetical protein
VGQGATVLSPGQFASAWDVKITKLIFGGENCVEIMDFNIMTVFSGQLPC